MVSLIIFFGYPLFLKRLRKKILENAADSGFVDRENALGSFAAHFKDVEFQRKFGSLCVALQNKRVLK